jgi:hypothetical protein
MILLPRPPLVLLQGLSFLLFSAALVGLARENSPPLPATPRVDLHGEVSLTKALAEIRRQTGITVGKDAGEPDGVLSLDLKQASFWQAIDAIAFASRSRVVLSPRDGSVSLARALPGDRRPPTSYDGDFRVRVLRIASSRDFDSDRASCTASLEVAWTPTLRPLFLESQVQGLRVLDERGKAVAVVEEASSLVPVDGRFSWTLEVALPGFPRSASRIGEVSGKLLAVAPNKMLTFRFDADLKTLDSAVPGGAVRRLVREDVTCRLARIKLDRGRWSITVGLESPEGGVQLDTHQAANLVLNNELTLTSKDGKRTLSSTGYVVEAVGSRRSLVTYHFTDKRGAPRGKPEAWYVQYRAPARIVSVPFRFSFRNLPLP